VEYALSFEYGSPLSRDFISFRRWNTPFNGMPAMMIAMNKWSRGPGK
jgi:hypothetical protein